MNINYEVSRDRSSLIRDVAFYDAAYSDTNALVWFGDETDDGRDCVYFPSTIKAEHFPALRNILRVFFGDTAANRMTAEVAEIRAAYEQRFPVYSAELGNEMARVRQRRKGNRHAAMLKHYEEQEG